MDGGLMREYDVDFNMPMSELGDFGFHLQAMHTKGEQERIKQGLHDLHTWVFIRFPNAPSRSGATYGWMLGPPPGGAAITSPIKEAIDTAQRGELADEEAARRENYQRKAIGQPIQGKVL